MLTQGTDPELRALAQSANHGLEASAPLQVIARAMQRGELKAGTDPALLLFTLAGTVIHRVFVEQGDASVEFVNDAVDLVLYGASAVRAQAKPD
jgi:hypothetical protein